MTSRDGGLRLVVGLLALSILAGLGCGRDDEIIPTNDRLLSEGQRKLAERKFLTAIEDFGNIGVFEPIPPTLDPIVKISLADAYFYQGGPINVVEAQTRYEQFLAFYPLHPKAPYARYQVGVCLLKQAERPENDQDYSIKALDHFGRMADELGEDDPWGQASRAMLLRAQDRLARHEWLIAMYYYERQKWTGAIGRLSRLVDRFPGFQRREEAFLRLADSYLQVGDEAKAQLSLDRMGELYPTGAFLDEAKRMLAELDRRQVSKDAASDTVIEIEQDK